MTVLTMIEREPEHTTHSRAARARRARVAIVGGGCAGLATAFELSRPEHQGRYEITVYQMGFRLGGKGASGRGAGGRIEEHGLHVWMGFYENAFRLMRECYGELRRDPLRCPIATWRDAFKPAPFVAVTDALPSGEWDLWLAQFPPDGGCPGDARAERDLFSMRRYLIKAATLLVELLRSADARPKQCATPPEARERTAPGASVERLVESVEWLLRHGQLATAAALVEASDLLRALLELAPDSMGGPGRGTLVSLIDAIAAAAKRQLARVVAGDTSLRRVWHVIELVLATLRGAIAHGLLLHPSGFDAIDEYDWRQWLHMHGASREALDSGFMRAIYDLTFAYENGDPARPSLSAGAALRGAMRMFFTYRGSLFWQMSAGMGDVVFAPLYEVLKRRGVRFAFFHRLTRVQCSDERDPDPHVRALHFDVQAELTTSGEYRPLVDLHGLPCWPARPDYSQLKDGAQLAREQIAFESPWEVRSAGERILSVGEDFDFVVLALGGGAVPEVCKDLIARSEAWKRMARGLHCVATQAFEVWMTEDMATLGFPHPPVTLSGWVEPFDTWADMSHLIRAEASRAPVRSIAYFCSPLPDPPAGDPAAGEAFYREQQLRVRDRAVRFLEHEIGHLWPRARSATGGFRWDVLAVGPSDGPRPEGPARFDAQFWTANVRPSDRYTLTLPGTQRDRLSPLDMSFDNLTIAGDWTLTGLNTGCVESAVISGLLAACALSGRPALEEIIGYDHS